MYVPYSLSSPATILIEDNRSVLRGWNSNTNAQFTTGGRDDAEAARSKTCTASRTTNELQHSPRRRRTTTSQDENSNPDPQWQWVCPVYGGCLSSTDHPLFFFLFDSLHPIFPYPFLHHLLLDLSLSLDPVKHPKRCRVDRLLSAIGESGSDK